MNDEPLIYAMEGTLPVSMLGNTTAWEMIGIPGHAVQQSNPEPLIHTTAGNVPVSSLVYTTAWEATADYVKFIETYRLDGVVVRQSAHVLATTGLVLGAEQAQF